MTKYHRIIITEVALYISLYISDKNVNTLHISLSRVVLCLHYAQLAVLDLEGKSFDSKTSPSPPIAKS